MYSGSKAFFYAVSKNGWLARLAAKYGFSRPDSFARRFVAGETVEEAIAVARGLQERGLHVTLDYLGESVKTVEEAETAAREYVRFIDVISAAGVERNLSLKLTQLGATVDLATTVDNLRRILGPAERRDVFVRIDMEDSPYVELTFQVFDTVWTLGHRNVGVVLQACLHRTEADVRRMNALGARVRLVKGAYKEPASVAYQQKAEVDGAYLRLMRLLLDEGTFPAIATHDDALLTAARDHATAHGIAPHRFEFQMLYGIRRDLQASLAQAGYGVRVYVPFGRQWFPYFMRRLGERPANVMFVLRSLLRER